MLGQQRAGAARRPRALDSEPDANRPRLERQVRGGGLRPQLRLLSDGRVACYAYGQLGPGAEPGIEPSGPVIVDLPEAANRVSAGREHTCARAESGRVSCWGRNDFGQLGNGESGSTEPNPTPNLAVWKSLCAEL